MISDKLKHQNSWYIKSENPDFLAYKSFNNFEQLCRSLAFCRIRLLTQFIKNVCIDKVCIFESMKIHSKYFLLLWRSYKL